MTARQAPPPPEAGPRAPEGFSQASAASGAMAPVADETPSLPASKAYPAAREIVPGASAAGAQDPAPDHRPLLLRLAALLALIFLMFATPLRKLFGFRHDSDNPSSGAPR